ncbi:MAG: hypothetical protein J0I49_35220 [Pseudonocardia sp.]|uniref:hypothetical protein n=1 Tax=Pseudonocardia sp. TaxID=60912 RepID=UPI001ACC9519|nr:hypothetical protein [Pseudonocardia sp.]MBN9103307.1 hypothetical protein [Pseudonocardia sp.]
MTQIEQAASASTVSLPSMRPAPTAEVAPPAPAAVEAPRSTGIAFAVVAALVCGALGLIVTPVLLGPAAIVGGFAGEHLGRTGTRKLVPAAILALTVTALLAAIILL